MSTYPRLDSAGLATLLTTIVSDGDGRWAKKTDLASASQNGLMSSTHYTKLEGIAAGAQVNTIEGVQRNGTDLTPDASTKKVNVEVPVLGISVNGNAVTPDASTKIADITVPTKVSDLSNDSKFQTDTEVNAAIADAIGDVIQPDYQVVQSLPATGVKGTFYLVPNSGSGQNIYDEYIWIDGDPTGHFELLGPRAMDLSGYVRSEEMTTIPDADIIAAVHSAFGVS